MILIRNAWRIFVLIVVHLLLVQVHVSAQSFNFEVSKYARHSPYDDAHDLNVIFLNVIFCQAHLFRHATDLVSAILKNAMVLYPNDDEKRVNLWSCVECCSLTFLMSSISHDCSSKSKPHSCNCPKARAWIKPLFAACC